MFAFMSNNFRFKLEKKTFSLQPPCLRTNSSLLARQIILLSSSRSSGLRPGSPCGRCSPTIPTENDIMSETDYLVVLLQILRFEARLPLRPLQSHHSYR